MDTSVITAMLAAVVVLLLPVPATVWAPSPRLRSPHPPAASSLGRLRRSLMHGAPPPGHFAR